MNNQLIKREDISIFDKIKGFFRRLFNKKTKKNVVTENKEQYSAEKVNEFEKSLRVDESNINTKAKELKEFINKIETNPDIIENLSNDRLDKLIVYYESITNAKRIKIEKLKSQIG
jgi:hypothetical protein